MKPLNSTLGVIASSVLLATASVSAAEITSNVSLERVKLFLNGAELQGTTSVQVPQGESEILLTHVANYINPTSINVGVGNEAMILSTALRTDYLSTPAESEKVKTLRASVTQLKAEQDVLKVKLSVNKEEIALLKGNRFETLKGQNNTISDARTMLNFVKDNLTTALIEQQTLQSQLDELAKRIQKVEAQITDEQGQERTSGSAIAVKIIAPKAMTIPVNVTYITSQAGWVPTYDVRVKDIDSPVIITYKANVYQNSGLDWNDIDFTLSSANPVEGITAPVPRPWNVYLYDNMKGSGNFSGAFRSVTTDMPIMAMEKSSVSMKPSSDFKDFVVTDTNGINTQYNVKLPYTIKGNSSNNIITLKAAEVAATYRYTAVPKLDNNAFLQAQIADWDRLALLPGKSTVFFGGSYIGEGYLTTQGLKETLDISLGRDKNIIISRDQNQNETSKPSFFGNNISRTFAYTINVRNAKTSPIDLTILDQLPVIQNKTITLEDAKYGDAAYNKETGLLEWNLKVAAGESKQLPFSFKVIYPKDKHESVIGL
ncbi:DUF4139 domain-containing protein [Zophobihabitans entericus]|uniref:Mucoidy inhibitor MuiA family protein n=1 Tax=Zophobihabitans entericus TaxID=1635327 RepID=A0A6G9IB58_9GAMM|nr:DUF4139 domain-containing protein [Zophobihabitans entericus]QIQ21067.1 mucoidy inhibitor MuiA family protein [Zophobihabitans entericus]